MKQMTSGMIALAGVLALGGCYSYASEAINNANYNTVQATPQFVVVRAGDSSQVIVRLVNDANNGAVTSYTVGSVGSGIAVHYQVGYRPVFDSKLDTLVITGDKNAQQYFVVGVTTGTYTFTLTPTSVNTGVTTTVNVVVNPRDLGPALSKTSGAAGDTVILTAPVNTVFSQTSAVTFTTGTAAIIARAADSSTITMVVSGGVSGPATVTKVGNKLVPSVAPVTLVSTNSLVTTAQALPTLSTTTAAAGATVTLTAGANTFFSPTSAISFATGAISITSRSADSTQISFLVGPGITGPATVTLVGLKSGTTLPLTTATSSNSLTTTALTVAPTTLSTLTPVFGAPVTVTLGAGLRFTSTSTVAFGTTAGVILSRSADSSSAVVVPFGGQLAGGLVSYTNIVLSFLNTVPLSVPGDKTLAAVSGPFTADPTALTQATAPTLVLPTIVGNSVVVSDAPPFGANSQCAGSSTDGCKVYKFVLAAATNLEVSGVWQGGADIGLYRLNAAGTTATSAGTTGNCDAGGQGTAGQPELCTFTALAAGTYFIAVDFYGVGAGYPAGPNTVAPTWFQFRITRR